MDIDILKKAVNKDYDFVEDVIDSLLELAKAYLAFDEEIDEHIQNRCVSACRDKCVLYTTKMLAEKDEKIKELELHMEEMAKIDMERIKQLECEKAVLKQELERYKIMEKAK